MVTSLRYTFYLLELQIVLETCTNGWGLGPVKLWVLIFSLTKMCVMSLF